MSQGSSVGVGRLGEGRGPRDEKRGTFLGGGRKRLLFYLSLRKRRLKSCFSFCLACEFFCDVLLHMCSRVRGEAFSDDLCFFVCFPGQSGYDYSTCIFYMVFVASLDCSDAN
jgi:hypothetical protein